MHVWVELGIRFFSVYFKRQTSVKLSESTCSSRIWEGMGSDLTSSGLNKANPTKHPSVPLLPEGSILAKILRLRQVRLQLSIKIFCTVLSPNTPTNMIQVRKIFLADETSLMCVKKIKIISLTYLESYSSVDIRKVLIFLLH